MRTYLFAVLLLIAIRWGAFCALLFTNPETADTIAEVLFGPARLANDFPRLFLPAIDQGVLRFVGGELLWLAVSAAAGFTLRAILRR